MMERIASSLTPGSTSSNYDTILQEIHRYIPLPTPTSAALQQTTNTTSSSGSALSTTRSNGVNVNVENNTPSVTQLHELEKLLQESSVKAYKRSPNQLDVILNDVNQTPHSLTLPYHTLPYIELLAARPINDLADDQASHQRYQHYVRVLIEHMDPQQLLLSIPSFTNIISVYTQSVIRTETFDAAFPLLHHTMQIIHHLLPNTYTSIHTSLLLITQKAHAYQPIIPIIDTPLYYIQTNVTGPINVMDWLLYYYYRGNCYAVLGRYEDASQSYLTTLQVPSQALSAIQIISYKKYILTSLLHNNHVPPLNSRIISSTIIRNIESYVQPYMEIRNIYVNGSTTKLETKLQQYYDILQTDINVGLARRLIENHKTYQLQKLTQVYSVLSVKEISQKLNITMEAAMEVVERCMNENKLHATIDRDKQIVTFADKVDDEYDDARGTHVLRKNIEQIKSLNNRLKLLDNQYALNRLYLDRTASELQSLGDERERDHHKGGRKHAHPSGLSDRDHHAPPPALSMFQGDGMGGMDFEDAQLQMVLEASKQEK